MDIENCHALEFALKLQDEFPRLFDVRAIMEVDREVGRESYTQYTLEDLELHYQDGDDLQSFYELRHDWQLWVTV